MAVPMSLPALPPLELGLPPPPPPAPPEPCVFRVPPDPFDAELPPEPPTSTPVLRSPPEPSPPSPMPPEPLLVFCADVPPPPQPATGPVASATPVRTAAVQFDAFMPMTVPGCAFCGEVHERGRPKVPAWSSSARCRSSARFSCTPLTRQAQLLVVRSLGQAAFR